MTLLRQIPMFLCVGAIATTVHMIVAIAIDALVTPPPLFSNLCGYTVAVLLSYFGHTGLTFDIDTHHKFHFPRFAMVSLSGLGLSSLVTWVVTHVFGFSFPIAMSAVAFLVPTFSFIFLKLWALVERQATDDGGSRGIGDREFSAHRMDRK